MNINTNASANIKTVRELYGLFGRGDIPSLLARLAENIEWDPDTAHYGIPLYQPRRGRKEVESFFESLGGVEFHRFSPEKIMADGDTVVALIKLDLTVRATGKRFKDTEAHVWTFDADGRPVRFRHIADTYGMYKAWNGTGD
ncbi:MAG: hypothetical protein C4523_20600 [Myxococcales bacterium]|nr:MAG: hypothetical protein C4523_20600 [Myxococcales bacterium]